MRPRSSTSATLVTRDARLARSAGGLIDILAP
jgi:predicted nucleic acid-binding protein